MAGVVAPEKKVEPVDEAAQSPATTVLSDQQTGADAKSKVQTPSEREYSFLLDLNRLLIRRRATGGEQKLPV